jgi:hypothetical protein
MPVLVKGPLSMSLDLLYMLKGCSAAVVERADRLLRFELGTERTGAPVTVATMFARSTDEYEPVHLAQHIIRIPPQQAVAALAEWLDGFAIDGEIRGPAQTLARAALAHAGRAV